MIFLTFIIDGWGVKCAGGQIYDLFYNFLVRLTGRWKMQKKWGLDGLEEICDYVYYLLDGRVRGRTKKSYSAVVVDLDRLRLQVWNIIYEIVSSIPALDIYLSMFILLLEDRFHGTNPASENLK